MFMLAYPVVTVNTRMEQAFYTPEFLLCFNPIIAQMSRGRGRETTPTGLYLKVGIIHEERQSELR